VASSAANASGRWHQTPPGRLFAGMLLGLGLGYGLLQLTASLLYIWARDAGRDGLPPSVGWLVFLGLQGAAVGLGGALAAVGTRKGASYGGVIGLLSGGIALTGLQSGACAWLAEPFIGTLRPSSHGLPFSGNALSTVLVLDLICGLVGGLIGGRMWRTPDRLRIPKIKPILSEPPSRELRSSSRYRPTKAVAPPSAWTGPVAWLRVLSGIGVAFGLAMVHRQIINMILIFGEGYIRLESASQETLAMKEIFALAILLGGCVAGATTPNGLKQGLFVGLGAGFAQTLLILHAPQAADLLFFIMLSAIFLAPLGGWFGSNLLPAAPSSQ
jgi:hypothetical protein